MCTASRACQEPRLAQSDSLRTRGSSRWGVVKLAAAIVAAEHEPATLELVSLDTRLNQARAERGSRWRRSRE